MHPAADVDWIDLDEAQMIECGSEVRKEQVEACCTPHKFSGSDLGDSDGGVHRFSETNPCLMAKATCA